MILTRKLALGVAGVAAAGVLGTAGVAAATSQTAAPTAAASSAPGSSPSAAPAAKDKKHKVRRAVLARGMHGEWVVKGKDGKPVTLETIRGQITAVGPASVTVKAADGFTETFTTNSDTKVKGAGATSLAGVKVGAKGAVVGVKSGNTTTARTVLVRK
jgi:glucose/arabinose dehydrogenase